MQDDCRQTAGVVFVTVDLGGHRQVISQSCLIVLMIVDIFVFNATLASSSVKISQNSVKNHETPLNNHQTIMNIRPKNDKNSTKHFLLFHEGSPLLLLSLHHLLSKVHSI